MAVQSTVAAVPRRRVSLSTVLREWGKLGVLGFGGPPAHVALLRELCVERRGWLDARTFEHANAACGLLPGPASTQLAIYTAHRVAGPAGAVVGGLAFIVPGLAAILVLAAAALSSAPPDALLAFGAGAGAAVPAVAADAGLRLVRPSLGGRHGAPLARGIAYVALGALAAIAVGAWVVVVLLACGVAELAARRAPALHGHALPILAVTGSGALGGLAWMAFKVGALSYGGGFVIVPLMQHDAVAGHHWMTDAQFLNAVAFGQLTPGPVVQTVAAVGYAAAGVGGGLLAAAVAFAPSFVMVIGLAGRFEALRSDRAARAFLDGAGPAAIGAILGAAVPLAAALQRPWQVVVLAGAAAALATRRAAVVGVLLAAGAAGLVALAAGAAIPS
jgi:chromate transporter